MKKTGRRNSQKQDDLAYLNRLKFDEHVGFALHCIFQKPIARNPFKSMCHLMRRLEYCSGYTLKVATSSRSENLIAKLINGICTGGSTFVHHIPQTKYCTISHLAELVSAESVRSLSIIFALLKESLGKLQRKIVTSPISATFVDILSVLDCITTEYMVNRPHKLLIQVMAIVEGPKLDDCLVVFIRRVFEELDHARKSTTRIVACHVGISVSDNVKHYVQEFTMDDIRMRRQLVLAALKSGIIDGGEVYIDYYLQINHTLPYCIESSAGYVHIRRKYHFCYVDEESKMCRFFSRQPLEPLLTGIFYSEDDILLYCNSYRSFAAKMESKGLSLIKHFADCYLRSFTHGAFVDAMQYLFLIACHIDTPSNSNVISPLSFILKSEASIANVIVDAVAALRVSIKQIIIFLKRCATDTADQNKRSLADDIFDSVHPSLVEIRHYVVGVSRHLNGSDCLFVCRYVDTVLGEIFHLDTTDRPKLPTSFDVSQVRFTLSDRIVEYCRQLNDIDAPLHRIEKAFESLSASIASDVISYMLHNQHLDLTAPNTRGFNILPTTLADLVGYVESLSSGLKSWQPYRPADLSLLFILRNTDADTIQRRTVSDRLRIDNLAENRNIENRIISRDYTNMQSFLELYDCVGTNWGGRNGVIDIDNCNKEEVLLDTLPSSFAAPGALMRYAIESKLFNYACDGYFDILSRGQLRNPYCLFDMQMNRAAAGTSLWRISDAEIIDKLYRTHNVYSDDFECFKIHIDSIQGGIFGPEEPLRLLGASSSRLFNLAHLLPPPVSGGALGCEYFCGMSLSTALRWGILSSDVTDAPAQTLSNTLIMRETSFVSSVALSDTQVSQAPVQPTETETSRHDTYLPGSIDLEVVSMIQLSSVSSISKVKQKFGEEMEHLVHYLHRHKHWNAMRVIIISSSGKQYSFAVSRLIEEVDYMTTMRKRVQREGVVTIETSVLVCDPCYGSDATMNVLDEIVAVVKAMDASDATVSDDSRIYPEGFISQTLEHHREGTHSIYVPCRITVQLLASMQGLHIPEEHVSSNHFLLNKQTNKFVIGSDATLAKLTSSTLWFSPTSARALWRFVDKSVSECIEHQRYYHARAFNMYCESEKLYEACEKLMVTQLLSVDENVPLQQQRLSLAFRVTKLSGLGRIRSIIESIQIVRYMFMQTSICSFDYIALANTIIRHISLSCRKAVLSEEFISCRGACILLLHKLCKLEECLCLGKLSLFADDSSLPHPPISKDYAEELWNRNLKPDAVAEFKSNLARAMANSEQQPLLLLADIENICEIIEHALTDNFLSVMPYWFYNINDRGNRDMSPTMESEHLDIGNIVGISQVMDDQRSEMKYHPQANYDMRPTQSAPSSEISSCLSEDDAVENKSLASSLHSALQVRKMDEGDGPPLIPNRQRSLHQEKSNMLHSLRNK